MTIDGHWVAAFAARRCGRLFPAALAAAVLLGAASAAAEPVFVPIGTVSAGPGLWIVVSAEEVFDDAGTNPRFTSASAANTERLEDLLVDEGIFQLRAKSSADLRALVPPPPNPFVTDVTVWMINDEDESGTGVITFRTKYAGSVAATPPPTPTNPSVDAPAGAIRIISVDEAFDNPGTNPRFTKAEFETLDYYVRSSTDIQDHAEHQISVEVKTSEQLRALTPRPPNPFAVEVKVTMANDEGYASSSMVTLETRYDDGSAASGPPGAPSDPDASYEEPEDDGGGGDGR